jgi:hypothetical protein
MNFLQLMDEQASVSQMQVAQPSPVRPVIRHRDPSPVASILVVICFVALSIGMVALTTHLERSGKNKPPVSARHVPPAGVGE